MPWAFGCVQRTVERYRHDRARKESRSEHNDCAWSLGVKRDLIAVYLAIKHPRMPWHVRVIAIIVVGYALSPIDLIPDFVPVLGYLDDIVLVPLGLALVIKLMPYDVLDECRREVVQNPPAIKPKNRVAAFLIVLLWLLAAYVIYKAAM